jgi:hypothetical protein
MVCCVYLDSIRDRLGCDRRDPLSGFGKEWRISVHYLAVGSCFPSRAFPTADERRKKAEPNPRPNALRAWVNLNDRQTKNSSHSMRFKKPTFHMIPAAIGLSIAALIAWGLSHWTSLSFWGAFAIVAGSMFINGVIAEHEDNAPGGFNNPLSPKEEKKEAILESSVERSRHRTLDEQARKE